MTGGSAQNEGPRSAPSVTLFVSDPTAEAVRVVGALRGGGYNVVDVPLSMLVARVAVQLPRIVLVDADSHGAVDIVARVRELPRGDDIPILFIAAPGGAIASPEEALAHEGSGFFVRPVDLTALMNEVDALTGTVRANEGQAVKHDSSEPGFGPTKRPGPRPSPASLRVASWPTGLQESIHFASEPPTAASWAPPPRAVAFAPLGDDLQRMLAEAEQRALVFADDSTASSPEQEVEAVLPTELLAALDEPLDEDEHDAEVPPVRPTFSPHVGRERTHDGGTRTTSGTGTSAGATPHGTGVTRPGTGEEFLTPTPGPRSALSRPPTEPGESVPAFPHSRPAPAAASTMPPSVVPSPPSVAPSPPQEDAVGVVEPQVGPWEAMQTVATAVARRTSASLCFTAGDTERRVVLREGDVVTCASTFDEETLIGFLGARGDLPRETVRRLGTRFPPFGRHAGAALVARGYLRQDQMWPTLRAHAEWVLARAFQCAESSVRFEAKPPGRLSGEPSVFGGSTGAEVFVDAARRVVPPDVAIARLGGAHSRFAAGPAHALLAECALAPPIVGVVEGAAGRSLRELLEGAPDPEVATILLALTQLGVLEAFASVGAASDDAQDAARGVAALDGDAVREKVRARLQLVEEGDYFALLGVSRDATGYEVRRAFLELRRAFDPSRLLSPELVELSSDVREIISVLEEAYEILHDPARRERYRRAIEDVPLA